MPPTTEQVYGFDISQVPGDGSLPLAELPRDYSREDAIRDGVADYNALLDLVRHFDLEDWPEEFRRWFMDRGKEPPRHSLKVLVGEAPHP